MPNRSQTRGDGFAQDDAGVDVDLPGGKSLRADYLVGCDGGRRRLWKPAGIELPGLESDDQPPDRRGRDRRRAELGPFAAARSGSIP
ncbi:MAG: FAD-dependent monooxygenase [Chloroflexota bacterium]